MVIDFHTHIFPHKIAEKTLSYLSTIIKTTPSMNGTREGLLSSMEQAGIDLSVILPVVTAPHQFDSILRFAVETNELFSEGPGPRLLSFAGIHPDCDDYRGKLQLIHEYGFKGIKLHPNYQGRCIDDIRYLRIIDAASELGLVITTHAGYDPATPADVYGSPDMLLDVIRETRPPRFVLAHMGSNENYEEALEKLCGQPVYLDTAYSLMHAEEDILVRMIRAHGVDRVLFASDAPWTVQKEDVEVFRSYKDLTDEEKDQILYKNACRLLDLPALA